jgi:hypothetical protein
MSTEWVRNYDFVDDKNAGVPITASRVDAELDDIATKLNQKVLVKSSAPASPIAGMLWVDSTNKVLKQYRNSEWVVMAPVHVGTSAPTTPQEGDIFWDSTNDKLYIYHSTSVSKYIVESDSMGSIGDIMVGQGQNTVPTWLAVGAIDLPLKSNAPGSVPSYGKLGSGGVSGIMGAFVTSRGLGTVYQAATDVMIFGYHKLSAAGGARNARIDILADGSNPPTTSVGESQVGWSGDDNYGTCEKTFSLIVPKGNYWKITETGTNDTVVIREVPLGT